MKSFFQNKWVHLAIGAGFCVALIMVAAKWLFSDSLHFAAADIEEGKTGSAAMLPLVFDAVLGGLIWVGATLVFVFGWVFNRTRDFVNGQGVPPTPAPSLVASGAPSHRLTTQSDSQALQRVVLDLGNAVAINDQVTAARLQRQLRFPFALTEMNEAYAAGDLERGKVLAAEVEKLIAADADSSDVVEAVDQPQPRVAKRGAK